LGRAYKVPFVNAAMRFGAQSYMVYNHIVMPTSFSGMDNEVFEPDNSPLQVLGSKALHVARYLFGDGVLYMKYHWLAHTELDGVPLVISRTGWSSELGFHI
jgi:glycine cleavage system aminomethyltransferase T